MPGQSYVSEQLSDNFSIAESILDSCKDVRIFAFYGEMGAGKTTLIKSFCEVLGVTERVNSPTFGLVHTYKGANNSIFHFDFYRIKTSDEAYEMGVDEYFTSGEYCFIEWPQRVQDILPSETASIYLEVDESLKRIITITSV
ncbi:MAG: tRNA (adenosine(37)-N6)-threonylcarbamoyltransferase complex ATPase subunit type 1 TsaE [Bacteroidia bacterium]|nr:tRNA (adenosine(37)-N6)-threonylcarbamoyltransferase complex ATPase subunit type 1 TsaE [Bacteroidia bacterium]